MPKFLKSEERKKERKILGGWEVRRREMRLRVKGRRW